MSNLELIEELCDLLDATTAIIRSQALLLEQAHVTNTANARAADAALARYSSIIGANEAPDNIYTKEETFMNGVDISHYQDGLQLAQLKPSGYDFAILKITDGTNYVDGSGPDFYMEAQNLGIPVGGYCYSHAMTPEQAREEARYILATIKGFPMPLGLYIDIEEPEQLALPKETLTEIVKAWGDEIMDAGYIAGAYGSDATLWAKVDPNSLDCMFVWVARYGNAPDTPCDLWQSTDRGTVAGYNGFVDVNRVRSETFERLVNGIDSCPIDGPCGGSTDVSGAFSLLTAYMQTKEFQDGFLAFVKKKGGV